MQPDRFHGQVCIFVPNNNAPMAVNPLAGKPATPDMLVNIPRLISAYYTGIPDVANPAQRVAFGTSGHRGSAFSNSFNERHILAIAQALCFYRMEHGIDGPLYLGFDTHALSAPAFATTMEVLAANGVEVMIAEGDEYTPTPVISHAILTYNKDRKTGLADGIVLTPSHNPPTDGGFKYNTPDGGPSQTAVTNWIGAKANQLLTDNLKEVKRISYDQALKASTTHRHDYLNNYINDLGNVIDMDLIRQSGIRVGVDPLGGAGVHYWEPIAKRYGLDLTVVNKAVEPDFRFMTLDWDGQIRMDPSSSDAMQGLIGIKDRFDISFACDTDHDRHGIVTKSAGLLNPNHYLCVMISYLGQHRPAWPAAAAVGKTVVSSQLIDRITASVGRQLYEVPVGFKWFVEGLLNSTAPAPSAANPASPAQAPPVPLCFVGEESAGATFSRLDGSVWTTDKDGFVPALLSAEITARLGRDPGVLYEELTHKFGAPVYTRIDAAATPEQKEKLKTLSAAQIKASDLAGEKIKNILTKAPGNDAPIDGVKVMTENGWFAARPSGTENIYKIYAESILGQDHLNRIVEEAQKVVNQALE